MGISAGGADAVRRKYSGDVFSLWAPTVEALERSEPETALQVLVLARPVVAGRPVKRALTRLAAAFNSRQ
jgi:hypothetical protein